MFAIKRKVRGYCGVFILLNECLPEFGSPLISVKKEYTPPISAKTLIGTFDPVKE